MAGTPNFKKRTSERERERESSLILLERERERFLSDRTHLHDASVDRPRDQVGRTGFVFDRVFFGCIPPHEGCQCKNAPSPGRDGSRPLLVVGDLDSLSAKAYEAMLSRRTVLTHATLIERVEYTNQPPGGCQERLFGMHPDGIFFQRGPRRLSFGAGVRGRVGCEWVRSQYTAATTALHSADVPPKHSSFP